MILLQRGAFLLLFVSSVIAFTRLTSKSITISPELPCPTATEECLTLQQFANNISQYDHEQNTSLTLKLFPGNHSLHTNVTFRSILFLNISSTSDINVDIHCKGGVKVSFNNVNKILLNHLTFCHCGYSFQQHNTKIPVIYVIQSGLMIRNCAFRKSKGVIIYSISSSINDTGSIYSENMFRLLFLHKSQSTFSACKFHGNVVPVTRNIPHIMFNIRNSSITLHQSEIMNNRVNYYVLFSRTSSTITLENCVVKNNTVDLSIVTAMRSLVTLVNTTIEGNYIKGQEYGDISVLYFKESELRMYGGTTIQSNRAEINYAGNTVNIMEGTVNITDTMLFINNVGSFYVSRSTVTFSGRVTFENCASYSTGGAFTSIYSTVIFEDSATFRNNTCEDNGGAVYAAWSTVAVQKGIEFIGNLAKESGGGVWLHSSKLICTCHCIFLCNVAKEKGGGGILTFGSEVLVGHDNDNESMCVLNSELVCQNNLAMRGGGLYFEMNSKLSLCSNERQICNVTVYFDHNIADAGAALYIDDNTYLRTCSYNLLEEQRCFMQTTLYSGQTNGIQVRLSGVARSAIFGGRLHECVVGKNTKFKQSPHYLGIEYLQHVTKNTQIAELITSNPVHICLCKLSEPYLGCVKTRSITITVNKGEEFRISLVAVDQVNHPVHASIKAKVSGNGSLKQNQYSRYTSDKCTDLIYNVYSLSSSENITLHLDNEKCSGAEAITVVVLFKDCKCPKGFERGKQMDNCQCKCKPKILQESKEIQCNISRVTKQGGSWIYYNNETGFVFHPFCPYHYCQQPSKRVLVKLLQPSKLSYFDVQCVNNRSGLLCGKCKTGFSLSLGTSRCLPCHTVQWPWTLMILIGKLTAGLVLVITILILNLTVSVGTLNGLIVYVNLLAVGGDVFFTRSTGANFYTIFIAWLNLDFGFDMCYFEGMDAYSKAWLQFFFPAYLITIIIMIILISKCSLRFGKLIGRWNPVATLATLLLLSFTKLLQAIINALAFTVINYPSKTEQVVWLSDASVGYFNVKHAPLGLAAIAISITGLFYIFILFSWQWLQKAPNKWIFKWTRNTKLNLFMEANLAPYKAKYRYWTGLLLLFRIVLYFGIATNKSHDQQTIAIVIAMTAAGVITLRALLGGNLHTYKSRLVGYLALSYHCNLLGLCILTLYCHDKETCQMITTKVSIVFASTLFFITLVYHIFCTLKESKFFKAIKRKVQRRNLDDSSNRNILETELKESVFVRAPTSTEVSLPCESNEQGEKDSKHSQRKSMEKRRTYSNKLRESLLQD